MKTLFTLLVLLITTSIVFSQAQSTVTIDAAGNRNKQVVVDNVSYTIGNTTATGKKTIVINNLAVGQHSLELIRNNQNSKKLSSKTSFTIREGYDLTLAISSDGSISSSEKRAARRANTANAQLTVAAFNKLYTQAKAKTTSAARAAFLENEFNTSTKKMTAKQASQLIQLVNSESLRLSLAKLSYVKVSDPGNFSLVAGLLSSTANRNDLSAYIESAAANDVTTDTNGTDAMSEAKFKIVYNEVLAEPTIIDRSYYLNNFFSRDFNYYTSAQAKQLIELVSDEQNRFTVAKTAYRGVTDKENYSLVYPLLTSAANRLELVGYVNTYDNDHPRAAMSALNFDKLYKSIYDNNSSTARYTAISSAFSTSGNYFTVAQAKRLIPLVSSETSRLQLAKASYKVLVDRSNYLQFNDFLSTTANRDDFKNFVSNYDNLPGASGMAMNETDFNSLYKSINTAWISSSKVQKLSDAFKKSSNYFTTYQVKQLLGLITNENDRLPLAKEAYDNTVDLANYIQLYDMFTSTANKNDLAAFVSTRQGGTNTTAKIAMTETAFKSLYREMQLTFGIGAKYSALTEIFNTETNYFTVAQARQLIQMVSSEENRLELAKSSYNNITDPSNFNQLYDIFATQASKNELTAYVNSNAYNN
jgi:hypothetical protein